MIKAAFFDIDGTLFSHKTHRIPPFTLDALAELRKRGVLLFIATGRHKTLVKPLLHNIFSFDGFVTLNGQMCLDKNYEIFYEHIFTPAATGHLVSLAQKKILPMTLIEGNRRYINYTNKRVENVMKSLSSISPPVGTYQGGPLYQATGYFNDQETEKFLADIPDCQITRWNEYGIDIIPVGGGKQVGIQKLLEHYDLSAGEVMAFGDGDNDAEMLKFAGIGVAMGNGSEKAKAAADYITADIDEDGIAQAVREYFP